MNLKVGDEILIDMEELSGHVCEVITISESGYIMVKHPTKNWQGYKTGFHNLFKYKVTKLTKLHKALYD